MNRPGRSSSPGESHREALTEPFVTLSRYTALHSFGLALARTNLLWWKGLILVAQLAVPSIELCHPLRSPSVTDASTLLQDDPPLALASVFFLMVSATCHFPSHPERSSHVPYQSLYRVHAAYTPAAAGTINRGPQRMICIRWGG